MKMASQKDTLVSRLTLRRELLRWYRKHHRKLPWRETRDPYKIWISEIMLQQTTVTAVLPYYERWLRLFPDVQSLARSPERKVLKAWQGLGYYARAKNLRQASKVILKDFAGQLPNDYDTLKSLPGFGPYTAAAVASFAFDGPFPVKPLPGRIKSSLHSCGPASPKKILGSSIRP
jgi:A/G-specific adenine glycosylase